MIEILEYILSYIERLSKAISWQLIVVILLFFGRKQIGGVVSSFANLLGRANKFIINGNSFTVETAVEKIVMQDAEIKNQNETIKELASGQIGKRPQLDEIVGLSDLSPDIKERVSSALSNFNVNKTFDTKLEKLEYKKEKKDPNKGAFGGKTETDRAILKASVSNLPNNLYKINIEVISKYKESPLTGYINFHLHPTFEPDVRAVKIENGTAKLILISYGSFTIGAECEGKRMELDLAELSGVSEEFKKR